MFGFEGWVDLGHVAVLIVFGLVMWRLAIRGMTKKFVD